MSLNILHITKTPIALAPARFVDLINKYTPHKAKLVQLSDFFLGMPFQIERIPNNTSILLDHFRKADILHFHGSGSYQFFQKNPYLEVIFTKKTILHYHGSPEREDHVKYQTKINLLLSTPEMIPLFPNGKYFPNLIDEIDPLYIKRVDRQDKNIKICHHFSLHPKKKNTSEYINLPKTLNNGISLHLLPKCTLKDALIARSQYDAVFDHLQGYYGLVSIEALAQGILAINSCSDFCFNELEKFLGARPPFYKIDKNGLKDYLEKISKEDIFRFSKSGQDFIKKYWSGKGLIGRLIKIYEA